MKKNSQIVFMSLAAILSLSASGCSVSATSDDVPRPQKPNANVEGIWASGCHYEPAVGAYVTETLTFHGATISDDLVQYSSSSCTGTPFARESHAGTFDVIQTSLWEPNGYNLNVNIMNASGVQESHCFTTVVEGDKLYLPSPTSDTLHMCPHYVDRTRAYQKVGG